ncbi:MAG: hypothetical protein IMZ50_05945 [Candidatus Atribacteria bacterium]|nr:hypothetical protein [Candidatus Atribacteria bacterium]
MALRFFGPGEANTHFTYKINANARNATDANGVVLSSGAIPYQECVVLGQHPGANAQCFPANNAGNVYLCAAANNLNAAVFLLPGHSLSLPDGGDLSRYYLSVANANDGVQLLYTDEYVP